ncbi:MAG TPA: HD domain-containing phosphohydrolase [Anaerovoracaceae bacterium]|nr:HD domain-containing phosphohydrolase [Anaerovoracaceae bacterium]
MKDLNLNINQVLAILLRALDHIDVRLVDHGHRVAYIVYKMMQADGSYPEKDMQEICIIASLHDIGAYKTEEIDHMMRFESEDVFDHSIYGYLFLKHMSPLDNWAEIVLYHHLNYEMHHQLDYEHLNVVDMIHLADRMDVILQMKERWLNCEEMTAQQDLRFGKATIELFRKANERYDIKGNIMNGSYLKELASFVSSEEYNDETLLEFIKMIAYSIDFRSETTVSHVASTVSISMELGKLFDLEEKELKKIQLGAYLHDIGKIATPLEILEKPGNLTQEEMQVMKQHIDIARRILKGRVHEDVLQITCHHHEKLDGSGYPLGLKAEQLTLNDRIVAVADIMSALAGKRSYKEGFPKDAVIGILRQQKDEGKLCERVIDSAIQDYDIIMESSKKNIGMITEMYNCIRNEFRIIKSRFEEMK